LVAADAEAGILANGELIGGQVLIAADDEAFVVCVRSLLESAAYRTLTAATGEEALRIARQEKPRVVLLEIELPALNGYQVCRALRDDFGHDVAIAFVSGTRTGAVDISAGLLFGADDYVVKPFESAELLARVAALMRRVAPERAQATTTAGKLTRREVEILSLLAQGLTQTDIARDLSISPRTVGAHIEHILGKLGVHSRAQAVAAAYRQQLIRASP
jgi:two-component system nitrate/nitrite response regulator NarL